MKKVPSLNKRKKKDSFMPEWKSKIIGVPIGGGYIEGGRHIKNFYKRLIKEHFYLGWRRGKYDKISLRLNEIRISPHHVNKPDGKSFILQQEIMLLFLTEILTEEEMNNMIAMTESEDDDNLYVAEMAVLQFSLQRVKTLGKANPNTQRSLENYTYAKKHYYNQLMPNAERIINTHNFEWEEWSRSNQYTKK